MHWQSYGFLVEPYRDCVWMSSHWYLEYIRNMAIKNNTQSGAIAFHLYNSWLGVFFSYVRPHRSRWLEWLWSERCQVGRSWLRRKGCWNLVRSAQIVEGICEARFVAEKDAPHPPMNAAPTIPKNENPLCSQNSHPCTVQPTAAIHPSFGYTYNIEIYR